MFLKRETIRHRTGVVTAICCVLFIGVVFLIYTRNNSYKINHHQVDLILHINDQSLKTMLAQSSEQRAIGLSQHQILHTDEAMLFLFEQLGLYSFWMKNMKFPIDIFWLDHDKRVVFIQEHAEPTDYPNTYTPDQPALYVLETVAGFAEQYDVRLGSQFTW